MSNPGNKSTRKTCSWNSLDAGRSGKGRWHSHSSAVTQKGMATKLALEEKRQLVGFPWGLGGHGGPAVRPNRCGYRLFALFLLARCTRHRWPRPDGSAFPLPWARWGDGRFALRIAAATALLTEKPNLSVTADLATHLARVTKPPQSAGRRHFGQGHLLSRRMAWRCEVQRQRFRPPDRQRTFRTMCPLRETLGYGQNLQRILLKSAACTDNLRRDIGSG